MIRNRSSRITVRAVLFDLDGTLVDSEPNYYLADKKLLERYGIPFSLEDKKKYIGGGNLDQMIDLKKRFFLPESPEELAAIKNDIYLDIAEHNTAVYPEMKKFLEYLRARSIPTAIASGSSPRIIERLLKSLNLNRLFDAVVSAEEVAHGKPAPDIFLEAAKRLGVAPEECLVMEDSQYGVESAKRAGMICAAIPYLTEKPLADSFAKADYLFENGMNEFTADAMFTLIDV